MPIKLRNPEGEQLLEAHVRLGGVPTVELVDDVYMVAQPGYVYVAVVLLKHGGYLQLSGRGPLRNHIASSTVGVCEVPTWMFQRVCEALVLRWRVCW